MKTIEERATEYVMPLVDDHSEGSLMTIRLAYMYGAKEQKKIDDANLHERFEKVLNGQKWDLIDEACKWLSDYFVWMSAQGRDVFLKEFREAMGDRYGNDGFNEGQALLYAVNKTAERTKKAIIDKACEWLRARNVLRNASIERFREEMEE